MGHTHQDTKETPANFIICAFVLSSPNINQWCQRWSTLKSKLYDCSQVPNKTCSIISSTIDEWTTGAIRALFRSSYFRWEQSFNKGKPSFVTTCTVLFMHVHYAKLLVILRECVHTYKVWSSLSNMMHICPQMCSTIDKNFLYILPAASNFIGTLLYQVHLLLYGSLLPVPS